MLKRRQNRVALPPPECPLTACLRFLRGAWTVNILWYLSAQPRRFTELLHDLSGISAKVLTQCLRRLERDGLVARVNLPTSPPSVEYALTDEGHELQPALNALVAVGRKLKTRTRRNSVDAGRKDNQEAVAALRSS